MTTIRDKLDLHQINADDRLRHSAGMGLGEPERLSPPIWPIIVVLALLAIYAAPDVIAWRNGETPVVVGRMK